MSALKSLQPLREGQRKGPTPIITMPIVRQGMSTALASILADGLFRGHLGWGGQPVQMSFPELAVVVMTAPFLLPPYLLQEQRHEDSPGLPVAQIGLL